MRTGDDRKLHERYGNGHQKRQGRKKEGDNQLIQINSILKGSQSVALKGNEILKIVHALENASSSPSHSK
jgi:hypothetical protein